MELTTVFKRLGSGLPYPIDKKLANDNLGFPEFESFHLADFSTKAQFSKSAASTIPPRPLK
ncbi:MAG: hypothetical protein AAGF93_07835 [Cyanobacteria bacterium P01_H01_bin.105]